MELTRQELNLRRAGTTATFVQAPFQPSATNTESTPTDTMTSLDTVCFACHGYGHRAAVCPTLQEHGSAAIAELRMSYTAEELDAMEDYR